ncbi:efflux RND transporter permease subunit [candidate division KSB1 bacterium]|nr:efflux RND transporter permease subunit [candidate division KSB1 bacterium]
MRLPKFAIDNHQFTMVLISLLVLNGVVSLLRMPKSEDPQVQPVGSSVIVVYPGGSPTDMEELIATPIEEALNELEDIRYLESFSEDGLTDVAIEFESGTDPDEKYADVVQKVNSIRSQLPENILFLETVQWSISDVHILQLALVSDSARYALLEQEAEELKKRIEKVSGIKKADIWAVPEQEVRISINLEKLAQMRIPLSRVMGVVVDANANTPGGHVDIGTKRLNIRTSGSYESLNDIRYTVIHAQGGMPVYLKDVADVTIEPEDVEYRARFNGKRCVFVTANQKIGTNIFEIFSQLRPVIDEFKETLPTDIELETVFDQSNSVKKRVQGFFSNLLQGILLVGIVIFAAVSSRASLIVMMAIPTSILIGIGAVALSGYGLEQMSIAGLVIAIGLLVDNAIVVTENTARFMRMGHSRIESAVKGTSQVGWAVVSATATTLFAFIPIILMRDVTGDFIRSMPVTVVYTLAASLLISLTLTPYLATKFLKIDRGSRQRPARRLMGGFIEGKYRRWLGYALDHPARILIVAGLVLVGSLGLFPLVGVSFFPKAEKPLLFVKVNTPAGSNLDRTDQAVHYVDSVLTQYPEIRNITANVGHGNPRIYYNQWMRRQMSTHADILIEMKEFKRSQMSRIVKELRDEFAGYPGARIEVKELEQGPPVEAPVAIRIQGNNLDVLKQVATDVEGIIRAEEGAININNPLSATKSDLQVRINRDKAAMLGIALSEIDRTVRTALTGNPVSTYRDAEGKEYDIVFRLPLTETPSISDFDRIYVSSMTGQLVPLKQVASLELTESPLLITHYDMDRNVTVTSDVESGYLVANVTQNVVSKLEAYPWPKGYRYNLGGEQESREESFGGMGQAVIIALIAIFGVLVLQFRSYSQPFIVFSAIPLAFIGSVLALLLTGNSFSFTAFIGMTSLVGIVVNNSIILVDYANKLRAEGKEILSALKEAGETRFIPIVLTTMTTIGGLLPLTLSGGSLWGPMGWTIIGGLLTSTFLTLIIVPVLYKLYTKKEVVG